MRFIDKENTPNDWTSQRISHYVEEHKGGAPLKPSDFNESGFPVIPKKAIQQGNKLVITEPTFCTKSFADKNTRSIVDTNYTITTLRDLVPTGPTIGTVVNFYSDEQYILSQGVYGLKLKSNIDRDYFAYASNAPFYRKVMKRVMVGSTQVHIRTPEYLSLEIQLPPLAEQRKIAKILSTWDKAISTTERLIDNCKQQKKALMQQLLTGKKRLLDDSGKPFEDVWEETSLNELLDKIIDYRGQSVPKADSGIPLITARNVRKGYLDFTNKEYIESDKFEAWMSRGFPKSGDILFTTEAPLAMACRFPDDGKYGVGQRTVTLRTNQKLDSDFLLHFLLSEKGQHRIDLKSSGSTAKGIKSSELKKIRVLHPASIIEQQKVSAVLTNADKEIELLEQQLADLQQEKKALMQQLLTGKRRVKVDEKEVA